MANKLEANSPFPKPSEYAKNYTTEAIKNGRVLAPPPIPTEYEVFGEKYNLEEDLIPPLKVMGIQAYQTSGLSWREEFKKLNASVVANFLDLLQILINSLDSPERIAKIECIRVLFINMHHLVNEYRPVQARTTLEAMLKHQVSEQVKLTDQINVLLHRAEEAICQSMMGVPGTPNIPQMPELETSRFQNNVRKSEKFQSDLLRVEMEFSKVMESLMTTKEGAAASTTNEANNLLNFGTEDDELMEFR